MRASESGEALVERVRLLAKENPPKLCTDAATGLPAYAKIYGVTNVMAVADSSMRSFAAALYAELADDPQLAEVLLLLPSESYHVTLRGLEGPLLSGVQAGELRRVDSDIQQRFSQNASCLLQFKLSPDVLPFRTAVVLGVEPASDAFAALLEDAQGMTDTLGASSRNVYHLSVGYLLAKRNQDAETDSKISRAEQQVVAAALRIASTITVDPPKICYYESMEKFVPIFQP